MREFMDILSDGPLLELFNQPLPMRWVEKSDRHWRGVFDVDGREYSVVCTRQNGYLDANTEEPLDLWELYFCPTDNSFATGVLGGISQPSRVFATALEGFETFIRTVKPQVVQVTADAEQPSRVKLYQAMERTLAPRLTEIGYSKVSEPKHQYLKTMAHRYVGFAYRREKTLNEAVEEFDVRGRDVRVFVNPSKNSLRRLLGDAKYDLLRGFTCGQDIFFWDANDAIHHQIWRQVTDDGSNVTLFMFGGSLEAIIDDAKREYSQDFFTFLEDADMGFFYTAQKHQLVNHPAFARLFLVQEIEVHPDDIRPDTL